MKKKSKIIFIVLLMTLLVSTIVFATDELDLEPRTSANIEDNVGEVNYDHLVEPISMDETDIAENPSSRGDMYIIKSNTTIEDKVDGNLFVISDNVDISADVDGNIFVMGDNVKINSNINGSAFVLAQNLNFTKGSIKDAYFYAENIILAEEAIISREAKMMGSSINVSGTISGDAYTVAEKVALEESGIISGKLVYSGILDQDHEGQVGSLEKEEIKTEEVKKENEYKGKVESILYKTITALCIIGLIVLASNKKPEVKVTLVDAVKGIFGGLLWVILIPIICIVLMITIVGIPFSLILLSIYIIMFFVAIPAVALQISAYILNIKNKDSKILLWLLAVVIYCVIAILRLIPVLNVLLPIIIGLYGFNLIIKTLFPKKKKEVAPVEE